MGQKDRPLYMNK